MYKIIVFIAVSFLLSSMLIGCSQFRSATPIVKKEMEIVNYETVEQGVNSGFEEATFEIIESEEEWIQLWTEHNSRVEPTEMPVIDFDEYTLAALFTGQKVSTGFSIEVVEVREDESSMYVFWVMHTPDPDEMLVQKILEPYHIIKIKKGKEIIFEELEP